MFIMGCSEFLGSSEVMVKHAARVSSENSGAVSRHGVIGALSSSNNPRPVASALSLTDWLASLMGRMFAVLACAALVAGFFIKRKDFFVPGEGLGYAMGIVGGCTMLLLLVYPLIKRSRLFRDGSKSSFWFRWHMILGVVGPLFILYHANFSMGATNSNVALWSMIVVAASGIIGRYIYGRVHNGLYGAQLDVGSLLARATQLVSEVESDMGGAGGIVAKSLADFGQKVLQGERLHGPSSVMSVLVMPIRVSFARSRILSQIRPLLKKNARAQLWSRAEERAHFRTVREDIDEFLSAVSRAAQMFFWERMFSLWHVLHVPLFFVLLVSGVIHVVAVHLY